jgi:hypothetical protein
MHSLISLYLSSGKKLFCAFVDFKKAFDTVWGIGLWQKLIKNKIGGEKFRVIFLYEKTTILVFETLIESFHSEQYSSKILIAACKSSVDSASCVKNGDLHSNFFTCETGVRQAKSYLPFYLLCI